MKKLIDLINFRDFIKVVDIGAIPIDSLPPYLPLLNADCCHVIGFEPQQEGLNQLNSRKSKNETYLPYVIGDGSEKILRHYKSMGLTSLLELDPDSLNLFEFYKPLGQLLGEERVVTRTLDSLTEIGRVDYLKMDVQGSELAVLKGGRRVLSDALVIQLEVSFVPLYKGQPGLGEIDLELRSLGFLPHTFAELKHWPIAPAVIDGNPEKPVRQLLEADLVYVKDIRHMDKFSNEQLKCLILIAHGCYRSFDLVLRCLAELHARKIISEDTINRYLKN